MRCSAGFLLAAAAVASAAPGSRQELPVLRARSASLDVVDGGHLRRGYWHADPSVELDVYLARRSNERRSIEFRSDLESLAFDVEPGATLDFEIELEGGARCRTRISAVRRGPNPTGTRRATLPMRVAPDGKLHLEARIGDSPPLDLMFDTGADTLVLYPGGLAKVPGLRFDGEVDNQGYSGVVRRRTSSDNRIALGDLVWEHEQVLAVPEDVDEADGILGWVLFEDLVVSLDLAAGTFRVEPELPAGMQGFERVPIEYRGSLPYLDVAFGLPQPEVVGACVLDTGSSATLHVSRTFADEHDLRRVLPRLGTSRSGGIGGGRGTNDVARLPSLRLGAQRLERVPVHLARQGGAPGSAAGTLGMDVLRRFDLCLDARGDALHLRPNAAFAEPFRAHHLPRFVPWLAGALAAVVLAWIGRVVVRRRRRGV